MVAEYVALRSLSIIIIIENATIHAVCSRYKNVDFHGQTFLSEIRPYQVLEH